MRSVGIMERVRRPPVLVGGGLLLLTGAIVTNALFLQSDRHPAPLFETRLEVVAPDPLVQSLQESLRRGGFYRGPVDGLNGPQTQAAIAAFERDTGRLAVGEPTQEILAAAQAYNAPAPPRPAAAAAPSGAVESPARDPQIAAVQGALAKAAYGPLQADGFLGQQTRDAIKRFERDHDMRVTGDISDELVAGLRAAGALDED